MAIWQFSCHVIPKENEDISNDLDFDEILEWRKQGTSTEKIDFLDKRKSWSDEISQYGKEDETCIEFIYDNEVLMEIHCRLDMRSLTKEMLKKILNFVEEIDGLIFYEGEIYSPNMSEIIEIIKKSRATRFCKDPIKFLQELENKDLEI